jgi:NAD(P)H-dependent FMN reductase
LADEVPTILAISGSLNEGSANTWLLERAGELATDGAVVVPSVSVGDVPPFRPDVDAPVAGPVGQLRTQIEAADAVLIATPEYAHALPGALKNALDWIVGSGELYGRRVAIVSAAPSPDRGANAREMLERTLRAQGAEVVWSSTVQVRPGERSDHDATVDSVLREVIAVLLPR